MKRREINSWLMDMDGVLVHEEHAIPGADRFVGRLSERGIPFLVLGVLYDRSPRILRPLVRHGRAVTMIGGLLVVAIGLAMLFDLLIIVPRYLTFLTAI
mgnify:CR=1 FL=1